MRNTFNMTAQETEQELKRREIPRCTPYSEFRDWTEYSKYTIAHHSPGFYSEEMDALLTDREMGRSVSPYYLDQCADLILMRAQLHISTIKGLSTNDFLTAFDVLAHARYQLTPDRPS